MNFEKKLIILSGINGKGTVSIERSAYGTYATLNCFGLSDLRYGEYALGLKTNTDAPFVRLLGGLGRISMRCKIPDFSLSALHCVVFESQSERVVLYGTADKKRLWESNLMDGLRSKTVEKKQDTESLLDSTKEQTLPNYSGRKEIGAYFLDILPKGASYIDDAVAQVNFYSPVSGDKSNSVRPPVQPKTEQKSETDIDEWTDILEADASMLESNAVDGFFIDATAEHRTKDWAAEQRAQDEGQRVQEPVQKQPMDAKNSAPQSAETQPPTQIHSAAEAEAASTLAAVRELPSNMERRYLFRYRTFDSATVFSQPTSAEPQKQSPQPTGHRQSDRAQPTEDRGLSIADKTRADEAFADETITDETMTVKKPIGVKPSMQPSQTNAVPKKTNPTVSPGKILRADADGMIHPTPAAQYSAESAVVSAHTSQTFYEQVFKQVEELLQNNPRFEPLEKLLPETRFVKIDYDGGGKFYTVGVIGTRPDYLCYGVPGKYSAASPVELDGYCQWLPSDPQLPQGDGYWLMFQDAATGESVQK